MIGTLLAAASAVLLLGVWWLHRRFVVVTIDGISMQPTFQPGDRVLVRRCRPARVRAGQIVVVERPDRSTGWSGSRRGDGRMRAESRDWYVKRAVLVGGERVPADLAERYRLQPANEVPAGSFLLFGDNPRSEDSKQWGYCPGDRLLGVVVRPLARG